MIGYLRPFLYTCAALVLLSGAASAQSLIYDNSGGTGQVMSNRGAAASPLARLTVGTTTLITNMAVDVNLSATGNIKFLIFDSTGSLLYSSTPKSFGTGRQWALSDPFSFTLDAGSTYILGGVSDVSGMWGVDTTFATQNGITSVSNRNATGTFASPTVSAVLGSSDSHIQLYAPSSAVPEPGTAILLAIGCVGISGLRRRRPRA
jgi:hypothetical protein